MRVTSYFLLAQTLVVASLLAVSTAEAAPRKQLASPISQRNLIAEDMVEPASAPPEQVEQDTWGQETQGQDNWGQSYQEDSNQISPLDDEPSRWERRAKERQNEDDNFNDALKSDNTPTIAREEVSYNSSERPGTIVIDTNQRRLYYILADNRAMRYGIGVGRPGFQWAGVKTISQKNEWPDWRPPERMIQRRPDLPRFMPGGPHNPLGARAMYLGSSIYRIHGSNEPTTIGQAVSSGCIRMTNDDVVDLYQRTRVGTKVVVR